MRQNFVAQSFKFWSVVCAMCCQVFSWKRIVPFLLTNAGCRPFSFWCISLTCWAYFSIVMVSPGTESCSRQEWQQTNKQWPWPFFGASLALESALELLFGSATELVITGCHRKSIFHTMSQSDWGIIIVWNKKRWHFKTIFLICIQLMRHPLIELLHLSILL